MVAYKIVIFFYYIRDQRLYEGFTRLRLPCEKVDFFWYQNWVVYLLVKFVSDVSFLFFCLRENLWYFMVLKYVLYKLFSMCHLYMTPFSFPKLRNSKILLLVSSSLDA